MESNNNIKKALDHQVPNWDDTAMWDQIEHSLPKEKKRRRFLWWLFSGAGLAAIAMITVLYLLPSQVNDNRANQVTKNSNIETTVISEKHKESISTEDGKPNNVDATANNYKESSDATVEVNSLASEIKINKSKISKESKNDQPFGNSFGNTPSQSSTSFSHSSAISQGKNHNITSTNISNSIIPKSQLNFDQAIGTIAFTPKSNQESKNKVDLFNSAIKLDISKESNAVRISNAIVFDFGIYGTLRSLTASDYGDWVSAKNEQETLLETVDFNLQFQQAIFKNMRLGIGVGYSQVNEMLTWTDTIVSSIDTTYTPSLQSVKTTSNVLQIETPNAYKTIYIPISATFIKTRDKWMYSASLGADISLFTNYRGRYLNTSLDDLSIDRSATDLINNNIGLQHLTASLNCGYQIREQLYLTAGLRGKVGIQNRLANSSTNLRYHAYGVQIGLRYNLE